MADTLGARIRPWVDAAFDPERSLVWNPPGSLADEGVPDRALHQIPQSAWYALWLAEVGDGETMHDVLEAVLATQYEAPGTPWHGTFARFAEWPEPVAGAVEWEDYDPNWRQFVGVTFALLLRRHRSLLDDSMTMGLEDAIARAVEGEQASGRLRWHYTNIALQHAWLLAEYGDAEAASALAGQIVDDWRVDRAFPEFNSPTYDGIDAWALALWRGDSELLADMGAELESGHWATITQRYHAGLRNVAGPYGRAYGLDLNRYLGKVAVGIAEIVGADAAPLPPLPSRPDDAVFHGHDLLSAAAVGLAPPVVDDDVVAHLSSFQGERSVEGTITTRPTVREHSAWLDDDLAIGAECGDSDWSGWSQFVAGTVHWAMPDGRVGVLRLVPDGPPQGRASPGVLRSGGPGRLEVHLPEPPGVPHSTRRSAADDSVSVLEAGTTRLPFLEVTLAADGAGFVAEFTPMSSERSIT